MKLFLFCFIGKKHGFWYKILNCVLLHNRSPDYQVYSSVTMENITLKLRQAPVEHHHWSKTGQKGVFLDILGKMQNLKLIFWPLLVSNSKSAFSLVGYNYPTKNENQQLKLDLKQNCPSSNARCR